MNHALLAAMSHFDHDKGKLLINEKPISYYTNLFSSPMYIYAKKIIQWRHQQIRKFLPSNVHIYYALKANPNLDVSGYIRKLYDGCDVSSLGEFRIALQAGYHSDQISFAGPGKTANELLFVIRNGIGSISVESEQELAAIQQICQDNNLRANILIRVNPDFSTRGSGMLMGGLPSKFGIESSRVPYLVESLSNSSFIKLCGIHVYNCSQNLNYDELLQNFKNILEYNSFISQIHQKPFDVLNLGGGFGIPYYANDRELDIESLGKGLSALLSKYYESIHPTKIIIELGRYLVGECGLYACKVLYRKNSRNQIFIITDGGLHHFLAATGNLGQGILKRPMPVTVANRLEDEIEKAHVAGPLCTPIDTFGYVEIPKALPGDIITVFQAGAYGFSASPTRFLTHSEPAEILV
jgi:diaminopimelate decarboxylase